MQCKLPIFVDCTYHKYYWYFTRFEDEPKLAVALAMCILLTFNLCALIGLLGGFLSLTFEVNFFDVISPGVTVGLIVPLTIIYSYFCYIKSGYCEEVIDPKQPEHQFFKTSKGTIVYISYMAGSLIAVALAGYWYRYLTLGHI